MDKLAQKIEKTKVLSVKLNYANLYLDDLESEKIVLKSCVLEVNEYLHHILDTRDSLLTVVVRQHLADKLKPIFAMLNRIEGVSECDVLPKQGEIIKNNSRKRRVNLLNIISKNWNNKNRT